MPSLSPPHQKAQFSEIRSICAEELVNLRRFAIDEMRAPLRRKVAYRHLAMLLDDSAKGGQIFSYFSSDLLAQMREFAEAARALSRPL